MPGGVDKDARGNAACATTDGEGCYKTNVDKVFAAGDMRRGQSFGSLGDSRGPSMCVKLMPSLMGESVLPR